MKNKKEMISVVIPMYHSAQTIGKVIDELEVEFARISDSYEHEIILVNDASPDNVFEVATEIAVKYSYVRLIDLAKNCGQANATFAGCRHAKGDYIVTMDDDFQTPGYEMGRMVTELKERNLDVLFSRYESQKESKFRLFGSRVNSKMTEIMIGKPKDIKVNSFFIMRRFVCDAITSYQNNYPYIYGIIFAVTQNVGNITVEHRERIVGESNYTLKKLLSLWLNGFLNFSIKPLRIATAIGVIISILSFIAGAILIIQKILEPQIAVGWTSLIAAIIFFSGLQLLSVGLLGEYLGRLFLSSSKLPPYGIRRTVNFAEESEDQNRN